MSERYINPFVDYGFKKLFGTEENKDLLISLLNALIGGEDPIKDLKYKNVEQIGEINGTRTNYFDVYCTTSNGEEFIVEMQNSWKPFFKDRMLYYAAKLIRSQGKKGIQKALDALENGTILCEDRDKDKDKAKKRNVELLKVDNAKLDLNTAQGKWMHALNSLYFYDKKPEELKEAVFDKLFRQAELAQLTPEEDLAYERSMKVFLDTYQEIEGGRILGHRQGLIDGERIGLAKGKALGLAEGQKLGEAKAKLETARKMLSLGMDVESICQVTGLTGEEVKVER